MIKNLKKSASSSFTGSGTQNTNALESQANLQNLDFFNDKDLAKLKGMKITDIFIAKLMD